MSWLSDEEEALCKLLDRDGPILRVILEELRTVSHRQKECCQELNRKLDEQNAKLDKILQALPTPSGKMELKFGTPQP